MSVNMANCTPGSYQYAPLAAALVLASNTTYFLVSQELAGGDQWYDYCPVTSAAGGLVLEPVYYAGNVYFPVPVAGYSYVPLNLLYQ